MDLDVLSRTVNVSWGGEPTEHNHSVLFQYFLKRYPTKLFDMFDAWQPLRGNRARVTLPDAVMTETFINRVRGIIFTNGERFTATRERYVRTVVLKYLPLALTADALSEALSAYGTVLSHKFCESHRILNGTREVEMDLTSHLPSCVSILGCRGLVSYLHQPKTCFVCHQSGHLRDDCPRRVSASTPTQSGSESSVPVPVSTSTQSVAATVPPATVPTSTQSVVATVPPSTVSVAAPASPSSAHVAPATPPSTVPVADPISVPASSQPVPVTTPAKPPPVKSYSASVKDSILVPPRDLDAEWATADWLSRQADSSVEPELSLFADDRSPPHRKHHRRKTRSKKRTFP